MARLRLGLALLVLLVRVPSLFEPRWYSDEGFYTTVAWANARGLALYAGVYDNSPPIIYWLYRLSQQAGPLDSHLAVQLLASAAAAGATVLTFEVGRRVLPPWPSTLAAALTGLALSLPVLDGDLFNVEIAALPFFLAALVLAFSRRDILLLAAGALLGLAVATRPSFAVDGLVLCVPLVAAPDRLKRLCVTGAGLALTALAVMTTLAAQGSLAAYFSIVVPADHAYLVWANGGTLRPLYARLLVLAAAALLGLRGATTRGGRLAAVWLPAALAGASLTPRELTHYTHEAIPAIAFTVALLAGRFRRRWLAVVPAALAVLVGAEAALILPVQETALLNGTAPARPFLHNFAYQGLPAYYSNWLDLVLARQSDRAYADRFPGSAASDRAEAVFLKSQPGSAGSRLIVLGDRPWLYTATGMLPATRYIATNSAFGRVPSAPDELTRSLSNACARFVVYEPGAETWQPALDAGGYVELPGAPFPTYTSSRAAGDCG